MNLDIVVSVCMITYNHELFIEEAINGVLMQRGSFKVELIIADDASTDRTADIINNCILNNTSGHEIKYTRHTINKGMMPNFIWALNQCNGQYIAICDGDDFWTDTTKIDKQINFLNGNPDYSLCFHPAVLQNLKTDQLIKQPITDLDYEFNVKNLLSNWGVPTASIVVRNYYLYKKFPDWLKFVESGDLPFLMFHYKLGKFKLLKEHMSVYRFNGDGKSTTHKGLRMIHYRTFIYHKLNTYFNYEFEEEIYKALFYLMKKHMSHNTTTSRNLKASELIAQLKMKVLKKMKLK